MAEVNTGIAKPNSCHCTCKVHCSSGLGIFTVIYSSVGHMLCTVTLCMSTEWWKAHKDPDLHYVDNDENAIYTVCAV